MKIVLDDLKSHNLTLTEAVNMAPAQSRLQAASDEWPHCRWCKLEMMIKYIKLDYCPSQRFDS